MAPAGDRHEWETLSVEARPRHALSPLHYSIFVEELNFGGEGGLYAELLRNRDFECLGRGNLGAEWSEVVADIRTKAPGRSGRDPDEPAADPADYRPWAPVGGAKVAIDNQSAPYTSNRHSLHMSGGAGAGVSNPGYWGIAVRASATYLLTLYARTTRANGTVLSPRLVSVTGGATISSPSRP